MMILSTDTTVCTGYVLNISNQSVHEGFTTFEIVLLRKMSMPFITHPLSRSLRLTQLVLTREVLRRRNLKVTIKSILFDARCIQEVVVGRLPLIIV